MPAVPCQVSLTTKLEELVEQLAENTHNIWARERILQGWTYGLNEDPDLKRSPHLVTYSNVDDVIKKANRDTASETVRTLLVYGYILEPPSGEATEGTRAHAASPWTPVSHVGYMAVLGALALSSINGLTVVYWLDGGCFKTFCISVQFCNVFSFSTVSPFVFVVQFNFVNTK